MIRKGWLLKTAERYADFKEENYYFAGNVYKKDLEKKLSFLRSPDTKCKILVYNIESGEARYFIKEGSLEVASHVYSCNADGEWYREKSALFIKLKQSEWNKSL